MELTNGELMIDIRRTGYRKQAISENGGVTWGAAYDGDISMTAVDAGLLRYSAVRDGDDLATPHPVLRPAWAPRLAPVRIVPIWVCGPAYDEGKTFINPVQLDSGLGAYSALEKLNDGTIGLIWEATSSTVIQFKRFDILKLEGAARITRPCTTTKVSTTRSTRFGAVWAGAGRGRITASRWKSRDLERSRAWRSPATPSVRTSAGIRCRGTWAPGVIDLNTDQKLATFRCLSNTRARMARTPEMNSWKSP